MTKAARVMVYVYQAKRADLLTFGDARVQFGKGEHVLKSDGSV